MSRDSYSDLQEKAIEWLVRSARLVLVVDPRRETVTAYRGPERIVELSAGQSSTQATEYRAGRSPVDELFG